MELFPLIIKWACHMSTNFRDLNNTGELREEFPHILSKITGYILKAELTPRMFKQRVEKAYLDNFTLGPDGEPDPMDVLEEQHMNYCDENETMMTDMFNPWGEHKVKESRTELYPWEEDSRSETTPDLRRGPCCKRQRVRRNLRR